MDAAQEAAATKRLLDALDADRNGRVDAREIIEMIQRHDDAEELIGLLRTHPDPEGALGIHRAVPHSQGLTHVQQELKHAKQSLETHLKRKGGGSAGMAGYDPNITSRLMRALDENHDGHVDAHELIQMIREHPRASEILSMIKEHPDPVHALGISRAPHKYRRRSELRKMLDEHKSQLHSTRLRVNTLQVGEIESAKLRRSLSLFSNGLPANANSSETDTDSDEQEQEEDEVAEQGDDAGVWRPRAPADGDTAGTGAAGGSGSDDDAPTSRVLTVRPSEMEVALQAHTKSVLDTLRNVPGMAPVPKLGADEGRPVSSLLGPNTHVFLGVWKRTTTHAMPGALPLCLCGMTASSSEKRVITSSYDSSSGVVWRFVSGATQEQQESDVDETGGFRAYLECTDHPDYSQEAEQHQQQARAQQDAGAQTDARAAPRLFLARNLTLVSSISEAATWRVRPCPDGSFRHGPADVTVIISLDSALGGSGVEEMYLCVNGKSGQVALVEEDRKDDYVDGYPVWDVAWEATPDDDDATAAAAGILMAGVDVPFESYMEDRLRS